MASFKDWALQFVLSEDEPAQLEIVKRAAQEIKSSDANRTVVGNWAASVQPWMSRAQAGDDDQVEDGDDAGSGDIIARAKALSFLAGTLEALDKTILRTDQVTFLVGFFGAMFSYDHKSGITASTKALQQLHGMKGFKPNLGVKMVEDVLNLKEDFRLQTTATRLEIYKLFSSLLDDQSVSSELQHKYGLSCGFVIDLLQLCQHERDPRNLMVWFKILTILLADCSPSTEVTEEIFKAFSAYFPISLKSSATPIGITAEDLKGAVRDCFSAHQKVAPFSFPFLIQKLDQGDAVTVAVKVDILRTIKACVEYYDNPQVSIVPYIEKIWNSLKYEVRNGEVKETIDATLDVLRSIANRLDGSKTQKLEVSLLKNYIDLVFKDCRDDLANPAYTKQAGLLLMTVVTSNVRSYMLENANLVDCIRQNLQAPKSPAHNRDLLLVLNSVLRARVDLIKSRKAGHPADEEDLQTEATSLLGKILYDIYLGIWASVPNKTELLFRSPENAERIDVQKQVLQGFALLARQQAVRRTQYGETALLCSERTCSELGSLLSHFLLLRLAMGLRSAVALDDSALEEEAQDALCALVMVYPPAYEEFAHRATTEIRKYEWADTASTPNQFLYELRTVLLRMAFVGCSEIPTNISYYASIPMPFSGIQHLITFTSAVTSLFPLTTPIPPAYNVRPRKEQSANCFIMAALHSGLLFFRDACIAKYTAEALEPYSKSESNWVEEFGHLPDDWLHQLRSIRGLADTAFERAKDGPEVYRQFLRLGLFITRHLYRVAVTGPSLVWTGYVLDQVADIATLVVRCLSEELQISGNLACEAFELFDGRAASGPHAQVLTLGILKGLRPAAMAELYKPDGLAQNFLCDVPDFGFWDLGGAETHASIGLILTNKYKGGPSTPDPEFQTMKRVLELWCGKLRDASDSWEGLNPDSMELLSMVGMHIFAGATARQDENVLQLVPALEYALAGNDCNADILARSMGMLVRDSDLLNSDNHGVARRFYKQWAYHHLAKPLYSRAMPSNNSDAGATRYRIAILSVASNCPFSVYEADVDPLVRLIITAINIRGKISGKAAEQFSAPLKVLVEILSNEPDALKGHIKAVIDGVINAQEWCNQEFQTDSEASKELVRARKILVVSKLALQALGAMPKKFEERRLLPYSPPVQRMLSVACGDMIREVRVNARIARASWAHVS